MAPERVIVDIATSSLQLVNLPEPVSLFMKVQLHLSQDFVYNRPGRIYIFDEISSNPLEDISSGYRYNRPQAWYLSWLDRALNAFWEKASPGFPVPQKFRWSQYAGCTCPCSPGFISDDLKPYGKNLYISILSVSLDPPPISTGSFRNLLSTLLERQGTS